MVTKRRRWARQRNWAIFQLRGIETFFGSYNRNLLTIYLNKEEMERFDLIHDEVKALVENLQKSTYKE
jgi:hypothetical protein